MHLFHFIPLTEQCRKIMLCYDIQDFDASKSNALFQILLIFSLFYFPSYFPAVHASRSQFPLSINIEVKLPFLRSSPHKRLRYLSLLGLSLLEFLGTWVPVTRTLWAWAGNQEESGTFVSAHLIRRKPFFSPLYPVSTLSSALQYVIVGLERAEVNAEVTRRRIASKIRKF